VRLVVAVVVTLLVAATLGALGSSGNEDDVGRGASTSIRPEDLTEEAQLLLELLDRRDSQTYHAVYEGTSPESPSGIRLESWQAPPSARQDTALNVSGSAASTSTIVSPEGSYRCTRLGPEQPLECRALPGADLSATDPLGEMVGRIAESDVTHERTTIDRRDVDCFTLDAPEGTTELCVTEDGIPVRVEAEGSLLRLVVLDEEVPSAVFTPPGPVVG